MAEIVEYSAITERPRLSWPDGKRLAVNVVVNVEHYEFKPPSNQYKNPYSKVPNKPDIVGYSYRDYGNRVGFWRMLEVLDRHDAKITCSLNCEVLDLFPEITRAMLERDWTFMSHGIYNTRYLFGMSEDEEREFYRHTLDYVEQRSGQRMMGMLGPSFTASPSSLELMAESGMIYSMDWFIDDQPFRFKIPGGKALIGVPYSRELNDAFTMPGWPFYSFDGDYFVEICKRQFDVLYEESAESGRVMTIALHPFYMGLPHLISKLDEVLSYIGSHADVWWTTPEEIAHHCIATGWGE